MVNRGFRGAFFLAMLLTALLLAGCGSDSVSEGTASDTVASSDVNGSAPAKICEPGKFFCSGKTAFTCNAAGTAYEEKTCPAGCLGGACNDCIPGEKSCDSATTVKTCKADGSGYDVEVCVGKCENDACVALAEPEPEPEPEEPACTAGEVTCLDAAVIGTCLADGSGYETSECDFGCDPEELACKEASCEKGAVRCNDAAGEENEVLKCNEEQSGWEPSTVCTQKCEDGECKIVNDCEPESTFCDGNDIKKCTADGQSAEVVDSCAMGCNEVSAAGPACNLCEEATVKCLDEQTAGLCADPSLGYTEVAKCAEGEMCASGKCVQGLAWPEESSVHDAYLLFTRYAAKCFRDGKLKGESVPCTAMDTSNLPTALKVDDLKDWWCANKPNDDEENPNEITLADFPEMAASFTNDPQTHSSESLYDAANDLHGKCSWFGVNLNDFKFKVDVEIGQPLGVYCMEFDNWLADEVFIVNCED